MMKYFKKLIGEKCYLSPMSMKDVEQYTEWLNDFDVTVNLVLFERVISVENEKDILERMIKSDDFVFAIVDKEKDELIGNCGLHRIDSVDRKAEFGIFIGNKEYWNKGYGTEATNLILDFAFNGLNLNNIMLEVYAYNKAAIHVYEKCGFTIIGKRRQARFIGGEYHDVVYMDILASEYESVYIKKNLDKIL
jgi:RimJ/RimL family protein N-acetyltransferase